MPRTRESPWKESFDMSAERPLVTVGYDGSDEAGRALEFATADALRRRASLRIVCAYEMPALSYTAGVEMPAEVLRAFAAAARREVTRAVDRAKELAGGADIDIEAQAVPGRPSRVLMDYSSDADVLVVGARRLGGMSRMFLGSVSTELIHHSHIPVVVVPGPLGLPGPDDD
jgi:nucleotide-binding universal stress UspA family protein